MAAISSSVVGCLVLLGSPARAFLVAAGAPPRHAPAGLLVCSKGGGRLAVVAAGAASLGESDDGLPSESFLVAAGAPPRKTLEGFLVSSSKQGGGRLAVVVAAGAASPGESDDELPSEEEESCEAAASAFRMEMELFRLSQRPVALALVGSPTDLLMDGAFSTAMDSAEMVQFLLAKVPVHRDILKELIVVGQGFLIVESQAKQGYVKADALVNAIQGLTLVGNTFFAGVNLPEFTAPPAVPLFADDVDKDSFFKELINIFIVFYTALYWEALKNHGFSTGGDIN